MKLWQSVAQCALWVPVGIAINSLFISAATVKGRSMQPALNNGLLSDTKRDRVLLDKFSIQFRHKYKRGDIVVLSSPEEPNEYLIKRLVGIEGDIIQNKEKGEYILIPRGKCWVEGDNPDFSHDSRTKFGVIPLALIEARVLAVIWPPSQIKLVENKLRSDYENIPSVPFSK